MNDDKQQAKGDLRTAERALIQIAWRRAALESVDDYGNTDHCGGTFIVDKLEALR
jgi:hypothetical protein